MKLNDTHGVQGTLAVRAEQQFNQALNEGDGSYKP